MSDEERTQHYRDEAERCRLLAGAVDDANMERELLRIALAYERLAGQIKVNQHLSERLSEATEQYPAASGIMDNATRTERPDNAGAHAPRAYPVRNQ
jgi:hypothetical protein